MFKYILQKINNFFVLKVAKLAALDEFKTQKEDLLNKLAELEQKIRLLELEHQDKLYDLEKKMVLDKDRFVEKMFFL